MAIILSVWKEEGWSPEISLPSWSKDCNASQKESFFVLYILLNYQFEIEKNYLLPYFWLTFETLPNHLTQDLIDFYFFKFVIRVNIVEWKDAAELDYYTDINRNISVMLHSQKRLGVSEQQGQLGTHLRHAI